MYILCVFRRNLPPALLTDWRRIEKKIFPLFLAEFKLSTFWLWVWHSTTMLSRLPSTSDTLYYQSNMTKRTEHVCWPAPVWSRPCCVVRWWQGHGWLSAQSQCHTWIPPTGVAIFDTRSHWKGNHKQWSRIKPPAFSRKSKDPSTFSNLTISPSILSQFHRLFVECKQLFML